MKCTMSEKLFYGDLHMIDFSVDIAWEWNAHQQHVLQIRMSLNVRDCLSLDGDSDFDSLRVSVLCCFCCCLHKRSQSASRDCRLCSFLWIFIDVCDNNSKVPSIVDGRILSASISSGSSRMSSSTVAAFSPRTQETVSFFCGSSSRSRSSFANVVKVNSNDLRNPFVAAGVFAGLLLLYLILLSILLLLLSLLLLHEQQRRKISSVSASSSSSSNSRNASNDESPTIPTREVLWPPAVTRWISASSNRSSSSSRTTAAAPVASDTSDQHVHQKYKQRQIEVESWDSGKKSHTQTHVLVFHWQSTAFRIEFPAQKFYNITKTTTIEIAESIFF